MQWLSTLICANSSRYAITEWISCVQLTKYDYQTLKLFDTNQIYRPKTLLIKVYRHYMPYRAYLLRTDLLTKHASSAQLETEVYRGIWGVKTIASNICVEHLCRTSDWRLLAKAVAHVTDLFTTTLLGLESLIDSSVGERSAYASGNIWWHATPYPIVLTLGTH